MSESKHTPGELGLLGPAEGCYLIGPRGFFIGEAIAEVVPAPNALANAERIVRTWNAHDELLEACRLALPFARQFGANGYTASILEAAIAAAEGRKE